MDIGAALAVAALTLAGVVGYLMNLWKLLAGVADPITMLGLLRVLGIVVAPVGAVVGWF